MNPILEKVEKENLKKSLPPLEVGSTIKIVIKIEEEGKERLQNFTGQIIAIKGSNIRKTITLRRTAGSYSVERNFLVHSPYVTSIKELKKGKVRKAKLYYLRGKIGKSAKIEDRTDGKDIFVEEKPEVKSAE